MSKLPIKIQVGVRDSWENTDAPVQKAIRALKDVVGIRVTANPEWPLLHTELGAFYPDKALLVPSVAAAVEACCTVLSALADDDANAEWADELLERTESHMRILVEVSNSRELDISWSAQQRGIIIALPKSAVPSQSYMRSFFAGSLLKLFSSNATLSPSSLTSRAAEPAAVDDWADIAVDNRTGTAGVVEIPQRHPATSSTLEPAEAAVSDVIPDVETVPRPDDLLLRPPYHLTVYGGGKAFMEVQCSHSATLQFLSDYLVKWSRTNHNNTNRPPCTEVKLHASAFGLGIVYDRLTISSETTRYMAQTVSPTILLALVEGVLGYRQTSQDGSSWTFRRDVEFRSSRY
ncbi:hypothetical protein F4825DRAFT_454750 [Nemania diffusa]|nr:hypothetical protein F4825DRAFT_454750 [Nemania diffusa]